MCISFDKKTEMHNYIVRLKTGTSPTMKNRYTKKNEYPSKGQPLKSATSSGFTPEKK